MESSVSELKIGLTQESVAHLIRIRKWAMFFSILGFIGLGLMVLAGIAMVLIMPMMGLDNPMGPFSGILLAVIYVVMAAIFFFPVFYLYRFSVLAKSSLASLDAGGLAAAFKNLKDHYTFIGILTVVILAIYAVALGVMLLAALLS